MGDRYPNKRMRFRDHGRFSKSVASDFGIGGVCPSCSSILIRSYDGDENQRPLNPAKFRYRCFTCEPSDSTNGESHER